MYSNCQIVTVGHCCIDRLCVVKQFPEENSSQRILDYSEQPGGTASQTAVTLSRLGIKTGYMSPLGDDEAGKRLYQSLSAEGVDLSRLKFAQGVITHFTNVMINQENGSRTFNSYHGKFKDMVFDQEDEEYIANAEILHLDNTKSINALKAARIAKKYGVKVSLDGSSLGADHALNIAVAKEADILITAEKYPYRLTGREDIAEALGLIKRIFNPKILITTLGERGSVLYTDQGLKHFRAYKVEAVDTTGAGDVFHGAFLYGLLKGFKIEDNIDFASAAAAINCMYVGGRAGIVRSEEEVRNFMKNHIYNNEEIYD